MKTKKKYNLIQTLLLGLTLLVASPTLTMAAETLEKEKSNHALAMEVILGDWGNGQERKDRLTEAGYEYQAIQDIVNSYQGILYDVSLLVERKTAAKQVGIEEVKKPVEKQKVKKSVQKPKVKKSVQKPKVKKTTQKPKAKTAVRKQTQSSRLYSLRDLQFHGVINWKGYKFTYYSQRV